MRYLNERAIDEMGTSWSDLVDVISGVVECLRTKDYAQPLKPYLRYRDAGNRIIAMPAFVGGAVHIAGLKWIASFPRNLERGLPRAHSVVILNEADTGVPVCIINTALLSVKRTTAVSGLVLKHFDRARSPSVVKLGIVGWGPIGRAHYAMCRELLGGRLGETSVFDTRSEILGALPAGVRAAASWQEAYDDADVFITCTVAEKPYIDRAPKHGSLQLNVSLRDYTPAVFEHVKQAIVVDDWEEVCRESTDIEVFHEVNGLAQKDVKTLPDVVCDDWMSRVPRSQVIMFNPMGMAVFDVAVGCHYLERAKALGRGQNLD